MVTLNQLCDLTAQSGRGDVSLASACALPRSAADMRPLPVPHAEFPFDSCWETLLSGTAPEDAFAD